ncbi:MAG: FdhF/YdeP family oxidoreductase [Cyclobacteriaceae bacterium]
MKDQRDISVVGSEELADLHLSAPKNYVAGLPAVKVALDHALKEMGLAKSIQTLSKLNQEEGIDCPGCAWPDPKHRSSLGEFCENGVKAIAEEATNQRADRAFFARHSVNEMSRWTDFQIGKSGRITDPMILRPGQIHYQPIEWEEAFKVIADELHALKHPDEAIFYTSGRSSNEAAFLYGTFIRQFGTNNMPDCSNMCHESSGVALKETLGIGKGSVTLEDIEHAEVVMVMGQNPGTNHPRMVSALAKCKSNGGNVVAINPIKEAGLIRFKNPQKPIGIVGGGEAISDLYLQVKINEDVALLKLIMKRLAALDSKSTDVFDHEFIKEKTQGFESLLEDLNQLDEQALLTRCGVSNDQVSELVDMLASKKKIIICWAMGLTQHKNGVDNIKECVNLLLLKGSIGKPGAGTCPVRGHSNVQGDRTVGIVHHTSAALAGSYEKAFGFKAPTEEGMDVVKSIEAMHQGKAKVFIALGGNFLSAASDTIYTGEALQNCSLTVSVSTKLNRTHLVPGKISIILPTLGRTERDDQNGVPGYVTVENSMGRVHRSKGRINPASNNLLSEPVIVSRMAHHYFQGKGPINWEELGTDYDLIRKKIDEVFSGFENYSERSAKSGFDLPNNAREGDFSKLPSGKAQFSICPIPDHHLSQDEFLLMTIRSHDQYNTTIYGMNDRYRGINNERRVVLMNQQDMDRLGLQKLDVVDLVSHYEKERKARKFLVIPYDIPQGNLAAYFPETNVLIPIDQYADKSQTPISKSVKVRIVSRKITD